MVDETATFTNNLDGELECTHAETYYDTYDFGYADSVKCDWVDDDQTVEVCKCCGAYRTVKKSKPYTDEDGLVVCDEELGDWIKKDN